MKTENQKRQAESAKRKGNNFTRAELLRTPHSAFRAGFTLIELLTVIAVIGVIAAMVFTISGPAKRQQYLKTARAELDQTELALDNFKAQYGVYPPCNALPSTTYTLPQTNTMFNQLYYELSGVTNNGTYYVTLDGSAQIKVVDVPTAYGVGGFINCSKGSGEDATRARNFLSGLKANRIYYQLTNSGIPTAVLRTSVNGPDINYQPLNAQDLNPFRYVYPGVNNPNSYDLYVKLSISGKTYLICNWSKEVQINSPLP